MDIKEVLEQFQELPIAYHKIYAKITGSITAGLLLSQLLYWDLIMKHKDFYKTDKDWCGELSIGLYELKSAKKRLLELDLINIDRRGVPAKTYYKANVDNIITLITSYGKNPQLEVGKTHNKKWEKPITIYTENNTENNTEICDFNESRYLADCINAFKLVNPDYQSLFGNTSERKAMAAVIKMITKEQLTFILENIVKINDLLNPYYYCTKPTELKRNMAKVISVIKQKVEKQNTSVDIDEIIRQRHIKKI